MIYIAPYWRRLPNSQTRILVRGHLRKHPVKRYQTPKPKGINYKPIKRLSVYAEDIPKDQPNIANALLEAELSIKE